LYAAPPIVNVPYRNAPEVLSEVTTLMVMVPVPVNVTGPAAPLSFIHGWSMAAVHVHVPFGAVTVTLQLLDAAPE
jgi:hypothetical protein